MNEIILFKDLAGGCWSAYHKGPIADEVKRLFGTDILPTAFLLRAEPDMVLEKIRELNPTVHVSIRG